ncbi:cupin domain-containing protein [Roseovarius pelagicus]|uniref:Cupin domain-containing protein n=1 Tax=Roseovarius pelagicus TaxID=2980108 RepID=A0ABY6DB17_9RHOB|nr:cupin domain-containing protein [Roseovarius pelagicus]UXX83357.1 cupin domain-containing protein [Roseovarius pelagicus]
MTPDQIIAYLDLSPHPEGGYFRETWRAGGSGRATGTAIYFLLRGGEDNHWHKVDAVEIWHFYAGAPLVLTLAADADGPATEQTLGPNLSAGEVPQVIVPTGHWQKARSTGAFTLVGCTVSPGFEFDGFTLAPPDFDIPH